MGHIRIHALVFVLGATALAACAPEPSIGKQLNEACNGTTELCAPGLECVQGKCAFPEQPPTIALCTAGELRCDGANLLKCDADGKQWSVETLCPAACREGACVDQICTPGTLSCELDAIVRCADDGLTKVTEQICDLGCDSGASGTTPTCRAAICSPGDSRCVDGTNKIETCNAAGTAWVSADCDAEGAARCEALDVGGQQRAACVRQVCTPLVSRCDGIAVLRCNAQGSGEELIRTCDFGCNDDGSCKSTTTCVPGAISCSADGTVLNRCNALGTYESSERCDLNGAGRCVATATSTGALVPRCVQTVCTPATTQCDGDQVLLCADDGSGLLPTERCEYGCAAGACKPPVCAINARRCTGVAGDVLEVCAADGRSFVFEQFCGSGCVANAQATGGAQCAPQVCSPFFARCAAATNAVERCASDGRSYSAPQPCPAGSSCQNGTCITRDPTCNVGTQRCNGGDIEICEAPTTGDNFYDKVGSCLGACSGQGCDSAGECGPIALTAVGLKGAGALLGDGISTFLILSEPLLGPSNAALPDGTLITVSVETTGSTGVAVPARIESGDQDPTSPGLQVPVVDGRIDFVVRAPALADDFNGETPITIRSQLGLKSVCSGTLSMTFKRVLAETDANLDVVYAAEDFSTFRNREISSSTASWNTKNGTLTISPFDAGDGRDGDLIVTAAATPANPVNLSTYSARNRSFGDASFARVVEFGAGGDTIVLRNGTDLAPFVEAGTRLMVMNQQGTRTYAASGALLVDRVASVGAWEVVTVVGQRQGALLLSAPVSRTFGQGGNSASHLADQAVYIYRLPQYGRVSIDGVLTATPWGGVDAGGGFLAFYARSADQGASKNQVGATGRITMDGSGFRGATVAGMPTVATCNPVGTYTPPSTFAPITTPNVCGNFAAHGLTHSASNRLTMQPDGSGGGIGDPSPSYYPSGFGSSGATTSSGFASGSTISTTSGRNDSVWQSVGGYVPLPVNYGAPGLGGTQLPYSPGPQGYLNRVGEGPDGRLNIDSPIAGYGSTPGGSCCRTSTITNALAVGNLGNIQVHVGSGAAHATMPISDATCEEAAEIVSTYGDPLLYDMFMGAGTGNVVKSTFTPCHTQRSCRPMNGGGCCRTYWNSVQPSTPICPRSGDYRYNQYTTQCEGGTANAPRDWRCDNSLTHTYCDGRATIKSETFNGKNGGGIIWITAAFLDLSAANANAISARGLDNFFPNQNPPVGSSATVNAGSAGGSIFIRADRLAPRTGTAGVISAAGGAGGGSGRIRLDVGGFTAAYQPAFASPAAVTAGTGAAEVGSRIVIDVSQRLDSRPFNEANVTVLNFGSALPLTATGTVDSAAAFETSGLAVAVSANGGLGRTNVVPPADTALSPLGTQVRWYLSPRSSNTAGATRGIVVAVKQQP